MGLTWCVVHPYIYSIYILEQTFGSCSLQVFVTFVHCSLLMNQQGCKLNPPDHLLMLV
jgi:hypothetical protein